MHSYSKHIDPLLCQSVLNTQQGLHFTDNAGLPQLVGLQP